MICPWRVGALVAALAMFGCATPLPESIESPRVNIADIRVIGLTVLEQRYALSLRMQNPNAFALPVAGMSVSLNVNGRDIGHGISGDHFTLPALGETVREVEVVSDLGRMAEALESGRRDAGQSQHYRLHGHLVIAGRKPPLKFEYRGVVHPDG